MSQRQVFLSSPGLWNTIVALAGRSRGRNLVAVPYVSAGASKLLKLGRGDVLLSALTKANCRSGAVCPAELTTFREQGVRLYQQADLHAKVYLLGKTLIVSSANLSGPSRDRLDETGVLSTERSCIREAMAWFRARLTQPVMPKWLKECERVYRPPRNPMGGRRSRSGPDVPAMRVWLMRLSSIDPPEEEAAIRKAGEAIARERKTRGTSLEWLRFTGQPRFLDRASDGDAIVQVWEKTPGRGLEVYPLATLLHRRIGRTGQKGHVVYLWVEEPSGCQTLAWSAFKQNCANQGLRLRAPATVREVRGARSRRVLLSVVSPERLSKRLLTTRSSRPRTSPRRSRLFRREGFGDRPLSG